MTARLGAARLAAVFAVCAGIVAVAATTAVAADRDRVGVHAPSSFSAGGSAGSVSITVTKRTKGCAIVQTMLGIELAGLPADQVRVEVNVGGQWQPVAVSGGDGGVATGATQPEKPVLCERKSLTVRYRVTFGRGAPAGTARLIGQVNGADGHLLGRAADSSRVVAAKGATPTPSHSATPSPEATEAPTDETVGPTTGTPLAAVGATPGSDGGGLGFGTVVMLLGVGMVGVGVALLVLLLRRNRAGAGDPAGGAHRPTVYQAGGYQPSGYPATGYQPSGYEPSGYQPGGYPPGGYQQPGHPVDGPQPGGYPTPPATGPSDAPPATDATVIMPRLPHEP